MRKNIAILSFVFFLFECNHPESNDFNRDSVSNSSKGKALTFIPEDVSKRNELKMEVENGVRYVWVEVNGIKLRFIFDTGASNICLSPAEARLLYRQGTLQKEDILSTQYFQDATGRISEGMKVNLRKITVGNLNLYNVEATVIDNINAPLLLGQSVLERFGKIEIDNTNKVIILE